MRLVQIAHPSYVIEAACLGTFMLSATAFTVLLEHPDSPARMLLVDPFPRRVLMGLAMGLTAAALIYSPLGMRSGAHMNPVVTLAWVHVGRMRAWCAAGYVLSQFAGGIAGMTLASLLFAPQIADTSVAWVLTRPGPDGRLVAFAAEFAMTFVMLSVVLALSARARWQPWTGAVSAGLVAFYITVEAPLSGMSINPARSLGPAIVAQHFDDLWIYFVAPTLGAFLAAELHRRRASRKGRDHVGSL